MRYSSLPMFGFLEKLNPRIHERHVESAAPGELLSADTFFIGSLKGVGRVYLHAVVDTYGSYAFDFLHVSQQPGAAVAVPHNDVLPFLPLLQGGPEPFRAFRPRHTPSSARGRPDSSGCSLSLQTGGCA